MIEGLYFEKQISSVENKKLKKEMQREHSTLANPSDSPYNFSLQPHNVAHKQLGSKQT